jgi:hypothetical protein
LVYLRSEGDTPRLWWFVIFLWSPLESILPSIDDEGSKISHVARIQSARDRLATTQPDYALYAPAVRWCFTRRTAYVERGHPLTPNLEEAAGLLQLQCYWGTSTSANHKNPGSRISAVAFTCLSITFFYLYLSDGLLVGDMDGNGMAHNKQFNCHLPRVAWQMQPCKPLGPPSL